MRILGRYLVTLVLIVVMAIPAVSPPTLRHCHSDGDKPHSHDIATADDHGHSHKHDSKHAHSVRHSHRADSVTAKDSHDGHAKPSASLPVEHRHIVLFGFECSLPLSLPDRSDSRQPIPNEDQWAPLNTQPFLPGVALDGATILAVELFSPTELTPRIAVRSEGRARHRAVTFLCDTARRERSGVLVV